MASPTPILAEMGRFEIGSYLMQTFLTSNKSQCP